MVSAGWSFYWKKLCDPVTSKSILVRFDFLEDGSVLRTKAFNIDGSAYSGNILSLSDCLTSPVSPTQIKDGLGFAWHTMEDPTTGDPISVRVTYTDDGTIKKVEAYYQDKSPYAGALNSLVEFQPITATGVAVSAGTGVVSSGTVIFSNSNSVSFGLSGQVLTASFSAASVAPGTISASGGSASLGQVVFANDHGLTFGITGHTVTASYTVPSTTGFLSSQSQQIASAGNGSFSFQTLKFADSQGVSFSTGTQGIFATVKTDYLTSALTSQSNQAASAGNGSFAFQTLPFADSQGVSFSTGTQGIYATVKTDYLTSALTSQSNQAASAANGSFAFQTLPFADSQGVSFSTGTQGIYATVKTDYLTSALTSQSNQAASAANGSFAFQTLPFADSQGVSFSTGTQGIFATVKTDYLTSALTSQSNQAASAANGSFAFQTLPFADSQGVSFSTGTQGIYATVKTDYLTTALTSQSNQAASAANGSFTFQTLPFADSQGVSFSTGTQGIFATVKTDYLTSALTSQSNQAASAANGVFTFQTLPFADSQGVSFSTGTQGIFATVKTDYLTSALTSQSNQAASASNGVFTFQTLPFADSQGVSFSTGTQGIFATVKTDYLTSQSSQAASAANGSFTFQTLKFGDSQGVSFSTGTQGIFATVQTNYLTAQTNQTIGGYAVGNTTGESSSSTFDARTLSFKGFGAASVGYSNSSILVSVPTVVAQTNQTLGIYASSQTIGQSSSYTYDARSLSIVGDGIISVGWSNSSLRISATTVAQTVESQSIGMSNLGNTSGTTGIASGGQVRYLFAGGNNVTLSQSINGASGTVTISAFNQSVESQSIGMSNVGNTSGTTGVASGGQVRYVFAGGNNVTLSQSVNGASGTVTISAFNQSVESQSIGMSNVGNTSGTTGVASGAQVRFVFAGGDNITLSQSINGASGTISISAAAPGAGGAWTVSDAATSGVVSRLAFTNLNGVTLSLSSGTGSSHTIVGSHNALTSQSNQAASAGNGNFTFQTLPFADSQGVSFSTGTQGIFATVKTDYLTSQSNQALSGSNGAFTFQTATFGNLNNINFYSSNGSMVGSYDPPPMNFWPVIPPAIVLTNMLYSGSPGAGGATSATTLSVWVMPVNLPAPLVYNEIKIPVLISATTTVTSQNWSATNGFTLGIYTMNAGTLSLQESFSNKILFSHASTNTSGSGSCTFQMSYGGSDTNATSLVTLSTNRATGAGFWTSVSGSKMLPFRTGSSTTSLSQGQYYFIFGGSVMSGGSALGMHVSSAYQVSNYIAALQDVCFDTQSTTNFYPLMGIASSEIATNQLWYNSFDTTRITQVYNNVSRVSRSLYIHFHSRRT